jgi:hypothetical protein
MLAFLDKGVALNPESKTFSIRCSAANRSRGAGGASFSARRAEKHERDDNYRENSF